MNSDYLQLFAKKGLKQASQQHLVLGTEGGYFDCWMETVFRKSFWAYAKSKLL